MFARHQRSTIRSLSQQHSLAGFGSASAGIWLDVCYAFGWIWSGFGRISASYLDSRMHTNFTRCSFLHFYHILASSAILIISETTSGHVPGWVESHVHP